MEQRSDDLAEEIAVLQEHRNLLRLHAPMDPEIRRQYEEAGRQIRKYREELRRCVETA